MPLIICQKQSFADVLQKEFLKNVTNLTGKHFCVAGLSPISQRNNCVGVSFPFRWLLLICLLFKSQSFKDLTVQFKLCLLLLTTLRILFEETITRTMSFVIAGSTKKGFWILFTITTVWLRSENGSNHWKGHWTLIGKNLYLKYG